ncbi:CHASE2 domain-containing protein [Marinospirillum insulare]|uniref:Adenylate/guanylate cyclase domain-containing protein n=1 Tax=Marinospirillum insulare TaxID=217169 RepID=A0ABQ5ZZV7_9GAMM|nr:adenylate/guanylate cyclase domain-containing protein [Marinospirillum insulare]GLR64922.1 adenylate/guanylate cyclase domain-containing protein [Marinospirillum insulare]
MAGVDWLGFTKKRGIYLLAAIFLLLVYTLALQPPARIESFASAVSDGYFDWNTRKPSDQLVFLEIENTSVQAFGRWPWSRDLVAQGLKRLEAAEVIGLDMLFSEPTSADKDEQLAEVLTTLPIIGGVFLNGPQAKTLSEQAYSQLLLSSLTQVQSPQLIDSELAELPIEIINTSLPFLAALNIAPDADHKFRRYPLAFWLQDAVLPNLGVQMWRVGRYEDLQLTRTSAQLGAQLLPIDKKTRTRINYYPEDAWQRISFAELMQPNWDSQRLANKWVVVGVSEAGVTDLRATPIGQLAGPLVHLTFLANLLDNTLLANLTNLQLLFVFLTVFILLLAIWQLSLPWLRFGLSLLLGVGIYFAGVAGYAFFNLWLEVFYPLLFLLAAAVTGEIWLFVANRAETAYLRSAFSSYVAPSLVDELVQQGSQLQLGGKKQQLTVLFSDLRGFTPTTELLETEELVSHLNRYFGLMIDEIHQHKGTLDKLIGDAVMALFNAPLADDDHAYNACLTAAGMMQALKNFNRHYSASDPHFLRMGIGINTGEAVVGNIGAANRFNFTAIGDAVNTSARLESATKEVNLDWQAAIKAGENKPSSQVDILIGEQTYLAVKDRLPCYPVNNLELKGKAAPLNAWVLDWQKMIQQKLLL